MMFKYLTPLMLFVATMVPAQAQSLTGMKGTAAAAASATTDSTNTWTYSWADYWVDAPASLAANAQAQANGSRGGSVVTNASSTAAWSTDGLNFSGALSGDWTFATNAGEESAAADFNNNAPSWSYAFTSDSDALLSFTYDVSALGDMFGLQGWTFTISQAGAADYQQDLADGISVFDPAGAGTITHAIAANTSYILSLSTQGNLLTGAPTSLTGSQRALFSGTISAVPEAGSWTLMIAGLGIVGGVLRRRRTLLLAA